MNRSTRAVRLRWAIVVLTAVALAGCGRKGALDLPPQASAQPLAAPAPAVDPDAEALATKGSVFDPSYGADRAPAATKGRKKPFILDPLLD